jgi:ParB-like chromosome segregation protein Spo0J
MDQIEMTAVTVDVALDGVLRPTTEVGLRIAAAAEQRARNAGGKNNKQGGIKDLAEGRTDVFRINPFLLRDNPTLNVRDMTDPANHEAIDVLAKDIAQRGVLEPLTVVWKDDAPVLTAGFLRRLAVFRAIEVYGAEIALVPVRTDNRFSNEVDHLLSQHSRNATGKPTSLLEQGELFKRLMGFGLTTKVIAERTGMSEARIIQILEVQAVPEAVKAMIRSGKTSFTLVWQMTKTFKGDNDRLLAHLGQAVEVAKENGRERVTARHVPGGVGAATTRKFKPVLEIFKAPETVINDAGTEMVTVQMTAENFAKFRALIGL